MKHIKNLIIFLLFIFTFSLTSCNKEPQYIHLTDKFTEWGPGVEVEYFNPYHYHKTYMNWNELEIIEDETYFNFYVTWNCYNYNTFNGANGIYEAKTHYYIEKSEPYKIQNILNYYYKYIIPYIFNNTTISIDRITGGFFKGQTLYYDELYPYDWRSITIDQFYLIVNSLEKISQKLYERQ